MADLPDAEPRYRRPLRLVSTAPLAWRSGHDVTLLAVRALLDRDVPISLTIVDDGSGDVDGGEHVRFDVFDLDLADTVTLTGGDRVPHLGRADAFVLAAVRGRWGTHLDAANDSGLPIVVSSHAAPDLPAPTSAVVFPTRDVAALAAAIEALT